MTARMNFCFNYFFKLLSCVLPHLLLPETLTKKHIHYCTRWLVHLKGTPLHEVCSVLQATRRGETMLHTGKRGRKQKSTTAVSSLAFWRFCLIEINHFLLTKEYSDGLGDFHVLGESKSVFLHWLGGCTSRGDVIRVSMVGFPYHKTVAILTPVLQLPEKHPVSGKTPLLGGVV